MSSKHYFPSSSATSLVPRYLSALVREHPQLELIPSQRVVYNPSHDRSCVAVISGGGSGHEPSWSGFVGDGLLAAAVCGDIFASPSTKQVLAAVDAVPSDAGVILMITNYTGDKLHFGLAAERAKAAGTCGGGRITVLPSTDDVSIGRSRTKAVGRRGMPGHVIS
jgi:dihydroxyacetone kinase